MSAPADQHALREALARTINPYAFHYSTPDNFGPDLEMAYFGALQRVALKTADALIAGPLAPHLAAEAENTRLKETLEAARVALELAEDVMSRSPFSTLRVWPNGMGSQEGITTIRSVLATIPPKENP